MEIEKKNQELDNIDEQNFSVRQSESALKQNNFARVVLVNVLGKNKTEDLFYVKIFRVKKNL